MTGDRSRDERSRKKPRVKKKPTIGAPDALIEPTQQRPLQPSDGPLARELVRQPVFQAMIQQLQRTEGNQAVGRYLADSRAGSAPHPVTLQRGPVDTANVAVSSAVYVNKFAADIMKDLAAEMTWFVPATGSPFVSWRPGFTTVFMGDVLRPLKAAGTNLNQALVDVLGFAVVKEAVNRGRDQADLQETSGPPEYRNAVALELRRVLGSRIAESLAYLIPRYADARNQLLLRQEALKTKAASTEPSAADILPSHPLDRLLIPALVDGVLNFDHQGFRKANPSERALRQKDGKRKITFSFEAERGLKTWIRVSAPLDPTPEEIAAELYGNPALATSLVVATPRFGFRPRLLTGDAKSFWESVVKMPIGGNPALLDIDPLKELLGSGVKDEAAMEQARGLKSTGASPTQITERLRLMIDAVDEVLPMPQIFGFDPRTKQLQSLRTALDQRSTALQKAPTAPEVTRWDAQSAAQLDIIGKAAGGVKSAAAVAQGFHITPADRDKVFGLPTYVWKPLNAMMMGYVDVLLASDITGAARTLLGQADARAQTFPIDMMEGILEYVRDELKPASSQTGSSPVIPFTVEQARSLEQREQKIRLRLVELREKIVSDPTSVKAELGKIQWELDNLQAETSVTANLSAVNDMWSMLFDHISSWGVVTGKNNEYSAAMDKLKLWYLMWIDIIANFKEKQYDKAKTKLYLLTHDGKFIAELQSMAKLIRDRESTEMWLDLVAKLAAMVAIALVTSGMGSFVEGMLVGGARLSAAGIGTIAAVSGAEAVTFTALNTALFVKDPTIVGTLWQLGENFLMFGAMRGVSVGYARFVGEAFAKSPAGKLLGGVVQLETVALTALLSKYLEKKFTGKELSKAEARGIVLESLAFTVGMAVAARCFEPFLKGMRLRGVATYRALFGEVDALRLATARQGQALAASGKGGDISKVLNADAATMKKEGALLERIEQRSTDPKTPAQERLSDQELAKVKEAKTTAGQAYAGNRRAIALTGLPQVEGNHFAVSQGQLEAKVKILTENEVGFKEQKRSVDPVSGRPTVELVNATGETITLTETSGSAERVITTPERPAPSEWTGCFVAGTAVDGVNGPVAIDRIEAGDEVLGGEPMAGPPRPQRVLSCFARTVDEIYELRLAEEVITTTAEHPFWVAEGWRRAGSIRRGDQLRDRAGHPRAVDAVAARPGRFTVYNLEVDGSHTYHVGRFGLLVHNKAGLLFGMSPELIARRNALVAAGADPQALGAFDEMFVSMGRDSGDMIVALNRIQRNSGDVAGTLLKRAQRQQREQPAAVDRVRAKLAGDADALSIVNRLIELERGGRTIGFNDWVIDAATRQPSQVHDMVAELRAVNDLYNRVFMDENLIIRYGQDRRTPGTSFDITLENRTTGEVYRSMDAKRRAGGPITHIDDIRDQITAAAAKIPGAAAGSTKEAAIFIDIRINEPMPINNRTQTFVIRPNLDWSVTVNATGTVTRRGNLATDLAAVFNNPRGRAQNIENLDMVTIFDRAGNELMSATKGRDGVWTGQAVQTTRPARTRRLWP